MYRSTNIFRRGILCALFGGFLFFSGCATTGPVNTTQEPARQVEEKAEPAKPGAEETVAVKAINVVGGGDKVLIEASGPVKYTVFRLSDPVRLIIDMPRVTLDSIQTPMTIDNEFVREITALNYGEGDKKIGRIIVGLKDGIDHTVKSGENSVLVNLKKSVFISGFSADKPGAGDEKKNAAEAASAPAPEEQAEAAAVAQPAAGQAAVKPAAASQEPQPKADEAVAAALSAAPKTETAAAGKTEAQVDLKPGKKIKKITPSKTGANTVIKILADGAIGNYDSFVLDSPSRLVVDIWGLDNGTGSQSIGVKEKFVNKVRIGRHGTKSRVVFDSTDKKKLAPYSVVKEGDSLLVTLGPGVKPVPVVEKGAVVKAEPKAVEKPVEKAIEKPLEQPKAEPVAAQAQPETEKPAVKAEPAKEAPKVEEIAQAEPVKEEAPAAKEETPAAKAQAPAAKADPAVIAEIARVQSIDFKKLGSMSRLSISRNDKTAYTVRESDDGRTLAIDLKGATISEELTRTLDAVKLKTAVLTISSYQESLEPEKDVRVLVKLAQKTPYNVKELGNSIIVEFENAVVRPAAAEEAKVEAAAAKAEVAAPVAAEGVYNGRKIDLDMMDANISDVLRLIAEVSNLNIIASDDVKGTISLRVKNVPWDQALDLILKSKDLDKIVQGNVVRVAPAAKIRAEREAELAAKKAQEKLEDLQQELFSINYAKADELVEQVKTVLTDRGSVTSEKRTNTLIIRDVRKGIESANLLIKKLDTPTPQVRIEARIVEAQTTFARDLGIQWGLDYTTGSTGQLNVFGSTTQAGQTGGTNNFAVNLPAQGTAGTLGALGITLGSAGDNPLMLDLRLSAGEKEGRLKTISRPRVTTLDNKEAKIEQGESIPFETTSATGTETAFIDANLSLTVTPQITPDGSVLMKIKASRNSIGTFRSSSGEPSINKKEASTEVLVRNGETTVIGGIVISDKNETENGIPYLRRIPLLGWLFNSKSVTDTQTELLIFITPTIIKEKVVS